ncbi:MAG: UbiA family prenyltransferase, partial [Gammaproteobacteria bacterium]|nr:UbiA family prenyltransferase [Gammaproteobacteria bacterium]
MKLSAYLTLCKPRVVLLMILTSMVGMALAPVNFSWVIFICGNIGIALMAGSAAAINHLVDRHIDRIMHRTQNRPIAQGIINTTGAIVFAVILCVAALFILIKYVNNLTALLTFITLIGYAGVYTLLLK